MWFHCAMCHEERVSEVIEHLLCEMILKIMTPLIATTSDCECLLADSIKEWKK